MALVLYGGTVEDCTPSNSISKVLGAGISPVNPVAGDMSYLWVNYDLSKTVYGGNITYSVTWNYIPMEPEVVDLCSQTECPMYPGIYNVTGNTTFPEINGLVEVTTQWTDSDDLPIWCVKTSYTL